MTIFLHRPSPQIPEPSVIAAQICVEAALYNIRLQREQIANKSVDVTWIFTQTLFMELNTALWALSYPEVRQAKPKREIEEYVQMAQDGIRLASERWPGVESALELYENLIKACLKAYEGNTSYVIRSPSNNPSPAQSHEITTPPPLSSPSTAVSSVASLSGPLTASSTEYVPDSDRVSDQQIPSSPTLSDENLIRPRRSDLYQGPYSQQPDLPYTNLHQNAPFDPNSLYNTLPANITDLYSWNLGLPTSLGATSLDYVPHKDIEFSLDAIGDQYSHYLHAPYHSQQPLESLNQEQQVELMTNLETTGLNMMTPTEPKVPQLEHVYSR